MSLLNKISQVESQSKTQQNVVYKPSDSEGRKYENSKAHQTNES